MKNKKDGHHPVAIILLMAASMVVITAEQASAQGDYLVPSDPPRSHYRIDARFDFDAKSVAGKEGIELRNNSGITLYTIAFDWSLTEFQSLEIATDTGTLTLLNTPEKSGTSAPLVYRLPQPLEPGSMLKLNLSFEWKGLLPPDQDQVLLQEWFPRLWWDGLPVYDSFSVKLQLPEDYLVAASGRLDEQTGRYENKGAKSFGLFMAKGLLSESKIVDGILITAFHTEAGSQCAKVCLDTAADVVSFYKGWLGFFPFDYLNIIPGGSGPWGGYPFAPGTVVIHGQEKFDSMPLLHWQWITAHEIGHQYCGDYILEADTPAWLWIGMGIYLDRTYVRARNLAPDKHHDFIDRYLRGLKEGNDTTIDIPPRQLDAIEFDRNNVVTHGKGYSVISALAFVLGKETYEKALMRCFREFGGRRLGYRKFQELCEEVSGRNLSWFFNQWVRTNDYLCYRIASQTSEKHGSIWMTKVEVERAGSLSMPVPVVAEFEDGSKQTKITDRLLKRNHLVFESTSPLKEVAVDPERELANLPEPLDATEQDTIAAIRRLPWAGAGDDALDQYAAAVKLDLKERSVWFKLGLMLYDGGNYDEAFDSFRRIPDLETEELWKFGSLVWMGHLKDLQGEREEALGYYRRALEIAGENVLTHSQYGMRINKAWVEERLKTPFQR